MKQRNNFHHRKNHIWRRIPAQSLCWLSSLSLLSSGLVFAQAESAVDNIVPTASNSSPAAPEKVKTNTNEVHHSASATQSDQAQTEEYSRRRAKLKQRLHRTEISQTAPTRRYKLDISQTVEPTRHYQPQNEDDQTSVLVRKLRHQPEVSVPQTSVRRLRATLKASAHAPVIIREERQQTEDSPQKVIIRDFSQGESAATTQPSNNFNRSAVSTSQPKDYNNAYIDPTEYNVDTTENYQAPNAVIVTERSSGCQTILAQRMSSALCAKTHLDANRTGKHVPNWLRRSQNAQIAEFSSPNRHTLTGENNPVRHPVRIAADEERNTPTRHRQSAADEESNTPIRHHSRLATDEEEKNTPSVHRPIRLAKSGETKSAYNPNRFIPNDFTPTTKISSTPIAPQGGALPAPMTADNVAPRPSTVAYNIPLASTLPQVSFGGRFAYGVKGLMFPLSIPSGITSLFGWRIHPITGERSFHSGTDLGAAIGTPVLAAYSGQVEIADIVGGYGLTVVLNHNNAQQTLYGHMSQILVQPGQFVKQGTVIGLVGSTGISTGPHLHFEVRQLTQEGWVAVDPSMQLNSAVSQLLQALQTPQLATQPEGIGDRE